MQVAPGLFLSYCTNIHAASGLAEVQEHLDRYATALKAELAPDEPFAVGLRLSDAESRELMEHGRLAQFKDFLDARGLVVYTLNGFPYGAFHGEVVKDQVHAPDWRSRARVDYTLRLVDCLAHLLPEDGDGGISTSPLSYKPWLDAHVDEATWRQMAAHLVEVVERLLDVRQQHGKHIHLDVEPEPDGLIETSEELVQFYQDWLLPTGGALLAEARGLSDDEARRLLLDHVQVCWDTCHVAVAYEAPREVLARYRSAGIRVGRLQISSALQVALPADPPARAPLAEALEPFAESTYLHQVVQRNRDGSLTQYPDLDGALPQMDDPAAAEWRVHFHVPIFVERFEPFGSTQQGIREVLALQAQEPFTHHMEIETYTWEVLPETLRLPLEASIRREYEWTRDTFSAASNHA